MLLTLLRLTVIPPGISRVQPIYSQAILFEVQEVPVESDEIRLMANGEGGEVGVHPDFWGRSIQAGESVPEGFDVRWFGKHPDGGESGEGVNEPNGIEVGEAVRCVSLEQRRSGSEAEKALLGGAAEARGTSRSRGGEESPCSSVVRMAGEREGKPHIRVKEGDQGGEDPPCAGIPVRGRAVRRWTCAGPGRPRSSGRRAIRWA